MESGLASRVLVGMSKIAENDLGPDKDRATNPGRSKLRVVHPFQISSCGKWLTRCLLGFVGDVWADVGDVGELSFPPLADGTTVLSRCSSDCNHC